MKKLPALGIIALLFSVASLLTPVGVGAQTDDEGSTNVEPWVLVPPDGPPSNNCLFFEETKHYVCDEFLEMWTNNGLDFGDEGISYRESLALYGVPLSQVFELDGLRIQVWERFVAESHPDNTWSPVLFRLLGNELRDQLPTEFVDYRIPDNTCNGAYYDVTTGCLQGFQSFWEQNGGLVVFGYPLNDEVELETTNGIFSSQLFERQLLEHHPENAGTPYEVLLARLGADWIESKICEEGRIEAGQVGWLKPCQVFIGEAEVGLSQTGPFQRLYDDRQETAHLLQCPEGCWVRAPYGAGLSPYSVDEIEADLLSTGCGLPNGCEQVLVEVWTTDNFQDTRCPSAIPAGETILIPSGCFTFGDVKLPDNDGNYHGWYDDDPATGLVVIVNEDVAIHAEWGASVAPQYAVDGTYLVDQVITQNKATGCGLPDGCQSVTVRAYPS